MFGKKSVPEELPDLAIDELKEELKKSESETSKKDVKPIVSEEKKSDEPKKDAKPIVSEEAKMEVPKKEKLINPEVAGDKSFFNQLLVDINEEVNDLDKLDKWYQEKFLPKDIISDMKNYWEDQKHEVVLKSLGKNFRERIDSKVGRLQEMEKEWQEIYFDLIEKEEEMKKEEGELKKILSEFVELCKRRGSIKNTE